MRTDRRYTRVRDMLLDESVPRLANGGIALCHGCQRSVYFKNGFLPMVIHALEYDARHHRNRFRRPLDIKNAEPVAGEDAAYEAFKLIRWPDGVPTCPVCASKRSQGISTRKVWRCKDCSKQYSVTSGTAFKSRKMSFTDIMVVCANFDRMNSRALAGVLGVQQGTTWRLKKKLEAA